MCVASTKPQAEGAYSVASPTSTGGHRAGKDIEMDEDGDIAAAPAVSSG